MPAWNPPAYPCPLEIHPPSASYASRSHNLLRSDEAEHALTDITKAIDINRAYNAAKAGKEFVPFVKLHPHALRHTFCSLCYESGVDAKACQTLMGHANISTTMNIYTHLSGKRIRTETQKVDQLIKAEPVKGKGKNYQKSNVI